MTPEERGRAMYESAPGDDGDYPWEKITADGQAAWIKAAAAYDERTQVTVRFEKLGRGAIWDVIIDGARFFNRVTVDRGRVIETFAKALGAKVVRRELGQLGGQDDGHPPVRWLTAAREEDFDDGPVMVESTRRRAIKDGHEQWGDQFWLQRIVRAADRDGHPHYEQEGESIFIQRKSQERRP